MERGCIQVEELNLMQPNHTKYSDVETTYTSTQAAKYLLSIAIMQTIFTTFSELL